MKKCIVIPDSFKGSLSSLQICGIARESIGKFFPGCQVVTLPVADGGEGTVYEHMTRILNFSAEQVGINGICKGLRADWNDCLNLGGGESAMVSFLHLWALNAFVELAEHLGRNEDAARYREIAEKVKETASRVLWDGD